MRRQRSAGQDSRHCHIHRGDTHEVVLPHHNTPRPVFGRPRRNSVGRASSPHCTSRRDRWDLGTCESIRLGEGRSRPGLR
eukprot:3917836-Prymnesium_polylepis.1